MIVRGLKGKLVKVRALLDSGAQGCVLSSWLVRKLGLPIRPHEEGVRGIGDLKVPALVGEVMFTFTPTSKSNPSITTSAIVLDTVVGRQPAIELDPCILSLTADFVLADTKFYAPGPVDVLLGADVLGRLLLNDKRVLQPGGLVAVQTMLGFVVMGPVYRVSPPSPSVDDSVLVVGTALSDVVQKFWEVEEPPSTPRVDPEQEECELFYQNNTGRLRSGRLFTRLPFRTGRPPLGESRMLADKRLASMERRMSKDPVFRAKYIDFMREYRDLGHMTASHMDWSSGEHYFLPHHAVLKSRTGKIRVVFDGSAPTSSGVSLNQCLHVGPKLHKEISDILTNFRRHQVVLMTDIRMMFRQTVIHPDDRRYQLILWRESPRDPVVVYELNTNTYGLASSPFVAIRSLLELAERERLNYPRASAILTNDIYVDDICTGASSVAEALVLRDELVALMKSGGYELRKWLSNSPEVLAGLPEEHQQDPHLFENAENPNMVTVLGVQYRPVPDCFTYCVDLQIPRIWTKRLVLSTVARTFDPNGWICPVIFKFKCFLQRLWTAGVSWDESLSGETLRDWVALVSSLPDINQVSLPRPFVPTGKYKASLHGFSDASEQGFAAVVFLRTVSADGEIAVHLVLAKSKVAPLRTRLTIPKLELCGAALLARLLNHLWSTLGRSVDISEVYSWTDSQIVLCWLKAPIHTLEVFVANRVAQINNSSVELVWRHVPGDLNPADCASRGCDATHLIGHPLWWGPEWLKRPESDWPRSQNLSSVPQLPGLRACVLETEPIGSVDFLLDRYSTLNKLLSVTAWIRRFFHNCKKPRERRVASILAPGERQDALLFWIRVVQSKCFKTDLEILRGGRSKLKGAISRLNPFLDDSGLIRVGGRLRNASLSYGARHPLLLPKDGHLVRLLVTDRHLKNSHAGCNALLAILQREFWILSARRTIRSVVFRCLPCYRLKATTMQPQMGDLPADRVTESRPFAGVGTDFAGPFMVKTSRLRNAKSYKAYLCVFVCLSTKAVHLEVVSELSTEAFIATLSRFVSRRGLPSLIRSDCGTNYKGANNYLNDVNKFLLDNKLDIGTTLSRRGIIWKFSPPACPHWGGIFEACVKAAKTHLRRVIGDTVLTFEELDTVFCKIEAVLNSRPLCPLSSDPNDLEALTPGHLLIGQPLNALPEYPFTEVRSHRLSRYQLLQQLSQSFWTRWSLEYLHILQQRVKWTDKTNPPKNGDLVLVKDVNLPPLFWRRGRIVKLTFGADGVPRFAEVLVGDSVLKRAVTTLSRLPVD